MLLHKVTQETVELRYKCGKANCRAPLAAQMKGFLTSSSEIMQDRDPNPDLVKRSPIVVI